MCDREARAKMSMTDASNQALLFVEAEFHRLMISDKSLKALCQRAIQIFLPHRNEAAPIIAELLKNRLVEGVPTSLVRVGNTEGNALGLTREAVHPVQLETFNAEFFDQVGMTLCENEARMLCGKIREALCAADLIGFRSFDSITTEFEVISNCLANRQIGAVLGILYARTLLQDELARGHFSNKLITSAWIHLALIPYICDIMDAAQTVIVITGRALLEPYFEVRLGKRLRSFIVVPPEGYRPRPRMRTRITERRFLAFLMPSAPICKVPWCSLGLACWGNSIVMLQKTAAPSRSILGVHLIF